MFIMLYYRVNITLPRRNVDSKERWPKPSRANKTPQLYTQPLRVLFGCLHHMPAGMLGRWSTFLVLLVSWGIG